jgi:hypothetical protein
MKENEKAQAANDEVKKGYEIEEATFEDFGFEKDENSGSIYDEVYYVKSRTKNAAYFEFSKREGDKILIDKRTSINRIEGKLSKIDMGSFTYEGKEIKNYKLYIVKEVNGKNILFILNMNYTQVGRSIINSILGCNKPIDKIYLELYKNASGYCSLKMLINGSKSVWKFSIDEQRKKIETITNKKGEFVSNDYTELDDLLEDNLRDHLNILFPEQTHVKFVEETKIENEEATFGSNEDLTSDEAAEFFDLNKE